MPFLKLFLCLKNHFTIVFYFFANLMFINFASNSIEKLSAHGGPVKGLAVTNDKSNYSECKFLTILSFYGL